MVYKFFDKKISGSGVIPQNEQLAEELLLGSLKKDNIWGADLADMQSIGKFNK